MHSTGNCTRFDLKSHFGVGAIGMKFQKDDEDRGGGAAAEGSCDGSSDGGGGGGDGDGDVAGDAVMMTIFSRHYGCATTFTPYVSSAGALLRSLPRCGRFVSSLRCLAPSSSGCSLESLKTISMCLLWGGTTPPFQQCSHHCWQSSQP